MTRSMHQSQEVFLQAEPDLPLPEKFSGYKKNEAKTFKAQFERIFKLQPRRFADDVTRILYVSIFLTGAANSWFCTLDYENLSSLEEFWNLFSERFIGTLIEDDIRSRMVRCRQKDNESLEDFNIRFRNLKGQVDFNDSALRAIYLNGLHVDIIEHFYHLNPTPISLDETMFACERISVLNIQVSNRRKPRDMASDARRIVNQKEPSSLSISLEEKERRRKANLCLYCAAADHKIINCPVRAKKGIESSVKDQNPRLTVLTDPNSTLKNKEDELLYYSVGFSDYDFQVLALVDTGASGNFISAEFVKKHNLPVIRNNSRRVILADKSIDCTIGLRTRPLSLDHKVNEKVEFLVVPNLSFPVILGLPWCKRHNPVIDWKSLNIDIATGQNSTMNSNEYKSMVHELDKPVSENQGDCSDTSSLVREMDASISVVPELDKLVSDNQDDCSDTSSLVREMDASIIYKISPNNGIGDFNFVAAMNAELPYLFSYSSLLPNYQGNLESIKTIIASMSVPAIAQSHVDDDKPYLSANVNKRNKNLLERGGNVTIVTP